jgi:DNA-binding NarL/FixJ family response regulator
MTIELIIVDDQALARAGLRMILEGQPDLRIVGEGADGAEAISLVRRLRPTVAILDIRMPHVDGLEATRRIVAVEPDTRILILTTFDLDDYAFEALRAGASGFLLKDTPPTEIINAVRLVASGEAMLSPSVTRTLLSHVGDTEVSERRRLAAQRLAALTAREREVAGAVGAGASNAEIATTLFMSEATVKAHVSRLFTKLEVANRVQIAIMVHDAEQA